MSIIFNDVASNAQLNLQAIEVTKEKRTTGLNVVPQRIAIIGQVDAGLNTYVEGVGQRVFSSAEGKQRFGNGSQLALMLDKLFLNSGTVDVVAFPLVEKETDTEATATININGSYATQGGLIAFYFAGKRIPVKIQRLEQTYDIIQKIHNEINSNFDLPFTSRFISPDGKIAHLELTCKWKGLSGNDIEIGLNEGDNESVPSGMEFVITQFSEGSGLVDVDTVLNNISESEIFTVIVHPFDDTFNLGKIEDFENVRWSAKTIRGFVAIGSKRGNYDDAVTNFIKNRNSFVSAIVAQQNISELQCEVAAAIGGAIAKSASGDPALQFHSLFVRGLSVPSDSSSHWSWPVRDSAVKNGASVVNFIGGDVVIDQMVNTYQITSTGAAAPQADRYVNSVMVLIAITYDTSQYFLQTWGRAKLANDNQVLPPGQKIMTPNTWKSIKLARYEMYISQGWCEDIESYKNSLICERNSSNPNRLDGQEEIVIIGNLRITAMKIGYDFAK